MNPSLSSHPAFRDPNVRTNLPGMNRVAEIQPLMPVNLHTITIPVYWPGDEWAVFPWDSVEYVAAPRSIMRVGPKLQHQRDDKGNVIFGVELEQAPNGDATIIATALVRRYGERGLTILGADADDEARKREARENRYNPWRLSVAKDRVARHRKACALAMRSNVAAPIPPPELALDEMFIRAMENGGQAGDISRRFVCQIDGSRWPTRSAAWKQVERVDSSQMSNVSAVLDTMHELADPEAVEKSAGKTIQDLGPKVTATSGFIAPANRGPEQSDPLTALRAEARDLKARAFDEDIMFPADLKKSLASDDLDVLQIAIEDARTIIDGPSSDTLLDRE